MSQILATNWMSAVEWECGTWSLCWCPFDISAVSDNPQPPPPHNRSHFHQRSVRVKNVPARMSNMYVKMISQWGCHHFNSRLFLKKWSKNSFLDSNLRNQWSRWRRNKKTLNGTAIFTGQFDAEMCTITAVSTVFVEISWNNLYIHLRFFHFYPQLWCLGTKVQSYYWKKKRKKKPVLDILPKDKGVHTHKAPTGHPQGPQGTHRAPTGATAGELRRRRCGHGGLESAGSVLFRRSFNTQTPASCGWSAARRPARPRPCGPGRETQIQLIRSRLSLKAVSSIAHGHDGYLGVPASRQLRCTFVCSNRSGRVVILVLILQPAPSGLNVTRSQKHPQRPLPTCNRSVYIWGSVSPLEWWRRAESRLIAIEQNAKPRINKNWFQNIFYWSSPDGSTVAVTVYWFIVSRQCVTDLLRLSKTSTAC